MDLIIEQGGHTTPLKLADGIHLVGRAPQSSVRLTDPQVSGRHARLRVDGSRLFVSDLGSLNGTELDGSPILPAQGELEVPPGSTLILGGVTLRRSLDPASPQDNADNMTIHGTYDPASGVSPAAGSRIMGALSGLFELLTAEDDSLEDKACAFISELVSADRIVMLEDSGEGTTLEKVGSWTRTKEATADVLLSSNIVSRVMAGRTSVLLRDVREASSPPSESMLALNLCSAMAVPLFDNRRVRGILYVDTAQPGTFFGEVELQILTATANAVGVKLHNRSLDRELATASRIQRALLPSALPIVSGYELHARLDMCRAVGGDLYHAMTRNRDTLLVAVGDVAGKGIPAALAMSACMLLISTLGEISSQVDAIVNLIHRQLWENLAPEQFITLFLGELDPETGALTYVNAGHEPPLIARANGRLDRLGPTGPPVALLPDSQWIMEQATLEPGDLLAFFSDGIPEATLDGEDFLGLQTLRDTLASGKGRPLDRICDEAFSSVRDFLKGNPPSDDVTLMLLRRTPS